MNSSHYDLAISVRMQKLPCDELISSQFSIITESRCQTSRIPPNLDITQPVTVCQIVTVGADAALAERLSNRPCSNLATASATSTVKMAKPPQEQGYGETSVEGPFLRTGAKTHRSGIVRPVTAKRL